MKLEQTKNCYAFAIRLLLENYINGVSPVIYNANYFHKFSWRIRDIKGKHPKLTYSNNFQTRKNRWGSTTTYKVVVPTSPKAYLINLHNFLNKNGLK